MWFWAISGAVLATVLVIAVIYDRRIRRRGYQTRDSGDIERNIAKNARWDKDVTGGGF